MRKDNQLQNLQPLVRANLNLKTLVEFVIQVRCLNSDVEIQRPELSLAIASSVLAHLCCIGIVAQHIVVLLLSDSSLMVLLVSHLSLVGLLGGSLLLENSLLDALWNILLARHGVILLLTLTIYLARLLVTLRTS